MEVPFFIKPTSTIVSPIIIKTESYSDINTDGSENKQLAADFDEDIYRLKWTKNGIFGIAWQKTKRPILRINPENGKTKKLAVNSERIWNYSFSKDGDKIAYSASNDDNLTEIYHGDYPLKDSRQNYRVNLRKSIIG